MIDFPDVLGMELRKAKALLEAEGLPFIILETKPTKKELTEGEMRIIRVQTQNTRPDDKTAEKTAVLTVCRI